MHNLENIRVQDLYMLDEAKFNEYIDLQSVMNGKPVFSNKKATPLENLEFGQVSKLKRITAKPSFEGLMESFRIVFNTNSFQYRKARVVEYFYALNWIKNSVTKIIKRENKALTSEPDPELKMAGVEKLHKFGEFSTLIDLGKKYGKSPSEIERWKYSLVFSIVFYDKVSNEVEKNYHEIKNRKNANKG